MVTNTVIRKQIINMVNIPINVLMIGIPIYAFCLYSLYNGEGNFTTKLLVTLNGRKIKQKIGPSPHGV